jgi:hypothetical protein
MEQFLTTDTLPTVRTKLNDNFALTAPAGSAGQIQFKVGSVLGADALLSWDNSNKRLGVGIETPTARVHIKGVGTTSGTFPMRFENLDNSKYGYFRDDGEFAIWEGQLSLGRAGSDNPNIARIVFYGGNGGNGNFYLNQNTFVFSNAIQATSFSFSGSSGRLNFGTNNNGTAAAPLIYGTNGQQGGIFFVGGSGQFTGGVAFSCTGAVEGMRLNTDGSFLVGTTVGIASSIVTFASTTKGFLIPRMTGAQVEAIATPAEGLMAYATNAGAGAVTSKGWWGYDGTTWVKLN